MNKIRKAYKKANEYENQIYISKLIFQLTNSKVVSIKAKNIVKEIIKYIVLMDLYYETKDIDFKKEYAFQKYKIINKLTPSQTKTFNMLNSKIVIPFWKYEEGLRFKIKRNHPFSKKEIIKSIIKRSEDSIIYGKMASFYCKIDRDFLRILHLRQAIEDIYDCVWDYEEDYMKEPNLITLFLLNKKIPIELHPKTNKKMMHFIKKMKINKELYKISLNFFKKGNNLLKKKKSEILRNELIKILKKTKEVLDI